jgi:SH3-like domain-containing protein
VDPNSSHARLRSTTKPCLTRTVALSLVFAVLFGTACNKRFRRSEEVAYVSAPQVNLRDRLSALYTRTGLLHNGERVVLLERQKRFARVRNAAGEEGWVELRYLVGPDVYNEFQKLAADSKPLAVQGHAATRASLNLHFTPSRDADTLFQLKEAEKIELLKRGMGERVIGVRPRSLADDAPPRTKSGSASAGSSPKPASGTQPADQKPKLEKAAVQEEPSAPATAPVIEDWWLVRDGQGHTGWALARMLDLEVPLDIAQYAEGQRIVGAYVLNHVDDAGKNVNQYLTVVTDNKDGMPFDFNQIRVFTWNLKRHRYETAYRERNLFGLLPVSTGIQDFGKEGTEPTFTIRVQDQSGQMIEKKYRLIGPIVRRVAAEGQAEVNASAKRSEPRKKHTR